MAGTFYTNATFQQTNWQDETAMINLGKKGFYNLEFTNMDNNLQPAIAAGSSIEIDGAIAHFDTEEAVTGTIGEHYTFIKITSSATAEFTTIEPKYSELKKGFYVDGESERYIFFATTLLGKFRNKTILDDNMKNNPVGSYSVFPPIIDYEQINIKDGRKFYLSASGDIEQRNPTETYTVNSNDLEITITYGGTIPATPKPGDIYFPTSRQSCYDTYCSIYTGPLYYWIDVSVVDVEYYINVGLLSYCPMRADEGDEFGGATASVKYHIGTGVISRPVVGIWRDIANQAGNQAHGSYLNNTTYSTDSRPGSPVVGAINFLTATNNCEIYTGPLWTWRTISESNTDAYINTLMYRHSIYLGKLAISSPTAGIIGVNVGSGVSEIYDGDDWIVIS
jgi:hypothetical protein